ncbi:MAG TPA: hypothetical protein VGK73_09255 [Polyangiaceae bacterium]
MLGRRLGLSDVTLGLVVGLAFAACSSDGDDDGGAGTSGKAGKGGSASGGTAGKGGGTTGGAAGKGGAGGAGGAGAGSTGKAGGGSGTDSAGEGGAAGVMSGGESGAGSAGEGGRGQAGEDTGGEAGETSSRAGGGGEGGSTTGGASDSGAGGEAGSGTPLAPIIVFDGGTANGGIEYTGRGGLDAVCAAAKGTLGISGGTPHALISVSESDAIADFPSLYGLPTDRPFEGPSGAVIADDFADLLDGSIDRSLEAAGVVVSEPGFWFTGSNSDGTASENNCSGWTSTDFSSTIRANYGYTGSTDSDGTWWLGSDVATATCSAGQYHVLCITW